VASAPWATSTGHAPEVEAPAGPLIQAFLNVTDLSDVVCALWQGGAKKEQVVGQLRVCWDVLDEVRGVSECLVGGDSPIIVAELENGKEVPVGTTVSPEAAKKSPSKTPGKSPETATAAAGTGPITAGSTGAASNGTGAGTAPSPAPKPVELDCSPWTARVVEYLVGIYRTCPYPEVAKASQICYDTTKLAACERAFLVSRQKWEEKAADGSRATLVAFETSTVSAFDY